MAVGASKITVNPFDPTQFPDEYAGCEANLAATTAITADTTENGVSIVIDADVDAMTAYTSTDPSQAAEPHKWLGLLVDTGTGDIKTVTYNGYELSDTDVQEAASCGGVNGQFVLWLKMDKVVESATSFTLATEGKEDTPVTISVA